MNKAKKILILGAGEMQVPIIETCKNMGHRALVVDFDPRAPGFNLADKRFVVSTNDTPEVLSIATKESIDGILTTSDFPVRTVARVCEKLNLPGLSYFTAETSTNKFLLREALRKASLPTPGYIAVKPGQWENYKEKIPAFPVIVKPVDSSASRGVTRVDREVDLPDAIKTALAFSREGLALIEEFVDGREFSIETLTQDGVHHVIAITEKRVSGDYGNFFVEDRHIIPANISTREEDDIKDAVVQALDAICLDNSASHTELKLTDKGPVIIEIGARLGGDFITSDLVPLATGVNMHENIIRIALNEKIEIQPADQAFSGIQFLNFKNYWACTRKIEKNKNNTEFVRSVIKPLHEKHELKNSLDRLGYYICRSESRNALLELLNFDDE